jgi:hypothetical protein
MFPNNNNNHNNNGIRYDPVGPIDINNPFPSLRPRNNNPFDISNPFGNNNNHNSFGYNPNRFFWYFCIYKNQWFLLIILYINSLINWSSPANLMEYLACKIANLLVFSIPILRLVYFKIV